MTYDISGTLLTREEGFEPTGKERLMVKTMAAYGVPVMQVAACIRTGISVALLNTVFMSEIARGRAETSLRVGKRLFERCADGDTRALVHWTRSQMGWQHANNVEITAPGMLVGDDAPRVVILPIAGADD